MRVLNQIKETFIILDCAGSTTEDQYQIVPNITLICSLLYNRPVVHRGAWKVLMLPENYLKNNELTGDNRDDKIAMNPALFKNNKHCYTLFSYSN